MGLGKMFWKGMEEEAIASIQMREAGDMIWSEATKKNTQFRRQACFASRLDVGNEGGGGTQIDDLILKNPGDPGQGPFNPPMNLVQHKDS